MTVEHLKISSPRREPHAHAAVVSNACQRRHRPCRRQADYSGFHQLSPLGERDARMQAECKAPRHRPNKLRDCQEKRCAPDAAMRSRINPFIAACFCGICMRALLAEYSSRFRCTSRAYACLFTVDVVSSAACRGKPQFIPQRQRLSVNGNSALATHPPITLHVSKHAWPRWKPWSSIGTVKA